MIYRKVSDFADFIFVMSNSFQVESLVYLKCRNLSSAKNNLIYCSTCASFIPFSCLISLAKILNTTLSKMEKMSTFVSFLMLEEMY